MNLNSIIKLLIIINHSLFNKHNNAFLMSIEWNSIRLRGPAHRIVTKTTRNSVRVPVHK